MKVGSNRFDQLCCSLSDEMKVYQALLRLAHRKADVVVKNDIDALDEILRQELLLQDERDALARGREDASAALAESLGMEKGASLRAFIARAPSEEADRLGKLRAEFSSLLRELAVQTQANEKFIQAQIDNINVAIEFMAQSTVLGSNYDRYGASRETLHRVSLLDTSV